MDEDAKPHFRPDLSEVKDGKADCYWCEKVLPINEMKQESKYGVKIYVCKDCQ
jgi:hypothetical protein